MPEDFGRLAVPFDDLDKGITAGEARANAIARAKGLDELQALGFVRKVSHRKLHGSDDTREAIRAAAINALRRNASPTARAVRRFMSAVGYTT